MLAAACLGSACAHTGATTETLEKRGTETMMRLGYLRSTEAGLQPASEDAFAAALGAARVVYLGEHHDDEAIHRLEAELFARMARPNGSPNGSGDGSVGLGLEMLPRTVQAPLDAYTDGRLDEAAFLAAVDWQHTWGFSFAWYRPLLELCRVRHLRAYALNAPKALTRAVARRGLDGLDAGERAELPELVPGPPAHRAQLEAALRNHPRMEAHVEGHGAKGDEAQSMPPAMLDHYYQAQLVWDETMADSIARALSSPPAPSRLFVVLGAAHAKRFAVPLRVERRGVQGNLVVLPIRADEVTQLGARAGAGLRRAVDWFVVLPARAE